MKKFLLFILLFQIVQFVANAQIQSGPMVGYSEMKEVMLWVQTQKPSKVKFVYWDKENPLSNTVPLKSLPTNMMEMWQNWFATK
jgi:alkaline phosphatase D